MASNHSPVLSTHNPLADEQRWVIQIRRILEEELDDDEGIPVSVFNVPNALLSSKPEAYVPQLFALGPHYHWRPELYQMERYKLAAAKRTQKYLQSFKLNHIADHFLKLEHKIRAHYHRYLDFHGETLAWMMTIDTAFLLEFLQQFADEEGKVLLRVMSRMSNLVESTKMKSTYNMVLRDIMMLENQIPLFLLRKILFYQCSSSEAGDDVLSKMLVGLVKEVSPFKTMQNFPCVGDIMLHGHLLELLYYMIVPKLKVLVENHDIEDQTGLDGSEEQKIENSSHVKQLLNAVWNSASKLNVSPIRYIKQVIFSRPLKFLVKVPWKIVSSLPGLSILKAPMESIFAFKGNEDSKDEDSSESNNTNKPPFVEEIMIPSVTQLINCGIKFSPTKGDLTTIKFDTKTVTLYLPIVSLDINTEVILRNLVAYESTAVSGPLLLTRYTELMNGIIDTEDDVMLLRQKGIIFNRMKSDGEVANLWNGMSKCLRLTKVPFLDKVLEDVNKYHSSRWSVKSEKFMKTYVFGSWRFLTFLAAVLLLLLTTLQAFCSVYTCARWFGNIDLGQEQG